jgi:hypothetical protein
MNRINQEKVFTLAQDPALTGGGGGWKKSKPPLQGKPDGLFNQLAGLGT